MIGLLMHILAHEQLTSLGLFLFFCESSPTTLIKTELNGSWPWDEFRIESDSWFVSIVERRLVRATRRGSTLKRLYWSQLLRDPAMLVLFANWSMVSSWVSDDKCIRGDMISCSSSPQGVILKLNMQSMLEALLTLILFLSCLHRTDSGHVCTMSARETFDHGCYQESKTRWITKVRCGWKISIRWHGRLWIFVESTPLPLSQFGSCHR